MYTVAVPFKHPRTMVQNTLYCIKSWVYIISLAPHGCMLSVYKALYPYVTGEVRQERSQWMLFWTYLMSAACVIGANRDIYLANFAYWSMIRCWWFLVFYLVNTDLLFGQYWLWWSWNAILLNIKQAFNIQGGPLRDVSSQVFDHVICQNCAQNYCAHNHSTPLLRVCVVGRELSTMIKAVPGIV